MTYLESDHSGECIFCEPNAPRSDRERLILQRGQNVFVLLNRYPYSAGHMMVAPYTHSARLEDLDPEVQADLMGRIVDTSRVLEKAFNCQGMNIGANIGAAGGAGFAEHLHFHLVPRWTGDVNFMTVVGEIRVIPKHLDTIFDELSAQFEELHPS
jgi:ATP adenylyltransferase